MRAIIVFISLLTAFTLQAQVDVSATVDTTVIRIGEQTKVTLEVSYGGDKPEVTWPVIKDTLQRFVEVVDPGVIDTIYKDGRATQRQEILITSWDSGYYAVPPFRFIVDGNEVQTDPFLLTVHTVEVDTTAAPMELKSIYDQPFSLIDWVVLNWPYVAIAVGILIAVLLLIFLRKKKTARPARRVPEVLVPAHEKALALLHRLKADEAYRSMSTKAYYTQVTFALRQYLEDRFDIQAMEQTTAEISEHLRFSDLDSEDKSRLREILMRADMAKFAKEDSSENIKKSSLDKAIEFITHSHLSKTQSIALTDG